MRDRGALEAERGVIEQHNTALADQVGHHQG